MILQLANHCNIALNQETLPLLHPLGGFKHYELLNTYKYKGLEIRGAYTSFAVPIDSISSVQRIYYLCCTELELMNGCSNGSVSWFKAMLQWLANRSIKAG